MQPIDPETIDPKHWAELFRLESHAQEMHRRWQEKKEQAKVLKEEYEIAAADVHEFVRRLRDEEEMPLMAD